MISSIRLWLGVAAALFLLNFSLSFHNIWPTPWITTRFELSVEIAALVFLLPFIQRARGAISKRLLVICSTVLLLLVVARYMEVTAPALYGRAINLYWDARYIPAVAAMIARAAPVYVVAGVIAGAAVFLSLVFLGLYWSLSQVAAVVADRRAGARLQLFAGSIVALYVLGYNTSIPTLTWFSIPVSQTYARQLDFIMSAGGDRTASARSRDTSALRDVSADSVEGDVIVTFIESYGAVAYDAETVATALGPSRERLAAAVEATQRHVVSAFLEPPTFGGGSWLSHISFMTGFGISDPASYDAVLTEHHRTLPRLFRDAGYQAVALMPGLRNAWPEGAFYGFDHIYGATELDYRGPEFGWWRIPDQYALAKLHALEMSKLERVPVFVFFPTISTHMPFRPTPPYQADWEQVLSAQPYSTDELGEHLLEVPDLMNLRPSYTDAVAYTYDYWSGYLDAYRDEEFLLVLLGDHQPPASVSGPEARWDVPVHIVTRNDELAQRLVASGFVPGMTPGPATIAQIHELGALLLRQPASSRSMSAD